MRLRRSALVLAGATMLAIMVGGAGAAAAATGTGTGAHAVPTVISLGGGHWGNGRQISLAGLKAKFALQVKAVSCPSSGGCTVAGSYEDAASKLQVFAVSEVNGVWGKPVAIPGLAGRGGLNTGGEATIGSLSCAQTGDCAVVGVYEDSRFEAQPFAADSVNGAWGRAHQLFDVNNSDVTRIATVNSVSCDSPGNCAAGMTLPFPFARTDGAENIGEQAYIATETGGTWATAEPVPDSVALNSGGSAAVKSVSCFGNGDCLAGGSYKVGEHDVAFITTESGGAWSGAIELPTIAGMVGFNARGDAEVDSVSCFRSGQCAVAGFFSDASFKEQALVASKSADGTWIAQPLGGFASLDGSNFLLSPTMSCGEPGSCGFATTAPVGSQSSNPLQAIVAAQVNGLWGDAQLVDGLDRSVNNFTTGLSCTAARCVLVGGQLDASERHSSSYVASLVNGTWGTAKPLAANLNAGGSVSVNAVSCASPASCVAAGNFVDTHGTEQAFIAEKSPATRTSLKLSAARAIFGHEHAEKLTVKVIPRTGGIPSGTVTIKDGRKVIATIRLTGGTASRRLGARQLRPGGHKLTATYNGNATYNGSASTSKALTVTR